MRKIAIILAAVLTLNLTAPATSVYAAPVDSETEAVVGDEEVTETTITEEETETESGETASAEAESASEEEESSEETSEEAESEETGEVTVTEETSEETTEETTEEVTTEETAVEMEATNVKATVSGTPLEASEVYFQKAYYKTSKGYPLVVAMDLPIVNTIRDDGGYSYSYPASPDIMTRLKISDLYIIIDGKEPKRIEPVEQCIACNGNASDNTYPELALGFNAGYLNGIEAGEHTVSYMIEFAWNNNFCTGTEDDTIYSVITPEETVNFVDEESGDAVYEAVTQYMPAYKGSEIKSIFGSFVVSGSTEKITSFKIINHDTKQPISYDVVNKYAGTPWSEWDSRYKDMGKIEAYWLLEDIKVYKAYYGADIRLKSDIPEGDYDIIYTTSENRKITNERAYRATKKTIVYDVRDTSLTGKNSSYDAVPVFSDNTGDYVSVFVYGLNITKANVPTFYDVEGANAIAVYSETDIGCGVEEWEYGYDYALKKTGTFSKGSTYPVRVSGDDVLYVENYSVNKKDLTYTYDVELVNHSELNAKDKYLRIYFSDGMVTEGDDVSVMINRNSHTLSGYDEGKVVCDSVEYYVEFPETSGLYTYVVKGEGWAKVTVTVEDKTDTFYANDIQKPNTITNITVPANCNWEIHSAKDVGNIIYSGSTTTKKAVLTDSQIAKLKKNHLYRVCIYNKNGNVISNGRYLAYFAGTQMYNITYELDGGENHPDNPIDYGKNDAYTLKSPTKEYHTFAGWYSDAKFTKKITKIEKGSKGDKTFYAKWTPYTYSIVYNANGGTGKMNATTGKYNVDAKIAKNAFKRAGYTFVKWSTTKDGQGEDVTFYEQEQVVQNLSLVNNAKVQLYAIWEPISYNVVLDKNSTEAIDGTIEAVSNSFAVKYGDTYVLSGDEYERTGYEIVSWNTMPNGKGKKIANGDVKNLTTVDGSTVTLYAQWAIDKYTITYDYDGGKVSKSNPKTYTYNMTKDITLNVPTKKGYIFEGYYEVDPNSELFTGEEISVTGIVKGTIGDKTFYAKWRPISYTIIFADKSGADFGDGITEESIRQPMEYGDVLTFTDTYYQRAGYRLVSWTGKVNGKNLKYTVGRGYSNLTAKDGDEITLYADWKKNSYTITYKLDGGKNNSKNPKTYAVDSRDIALKNPTKKGYTFGGWYLTDENGNLAEEPITVIEGEMNQNLVLTAKWTPIVYSVEIYPNTKDYLAPEDLEPTTETYNYGEKFNPQDWSDKYQPTEIWENQGYGILYWSTKSNGTGTKYYPGKEYSNLATGGTVKLYAKWGMKPYAINYDYGDVEAKGISNKNPATFTYNATAKITLKNISKTGYVFGGWYTDSSFAEECKVTTISRNTCEDITLFAKLTPISYTIKLNPNGSNVIAKDGLVTEIPVVYNGSYELEADAYTREHYEFDYWTTKADGKGTKVALTGGTAPLTKTNGAKVNLYPKWKLTSYTITYNNVTFENEKITNSSPKTYTYNAKKDVVLKNPTRTGYVFGGWYEEDTTAQDFDASTATKVTKIVKGSDGDKVLYALWTPIRYKIKLYANAKDAESGTIAINSADEVMEVAYGEEVCLYTDFYKRAGYNLVGFNSKANGKGTAYTVGHYDCIYATKANSTVKVYAIWEKVKPEKVSGVELSATQDSVSVNFEISDMSNVYRYEVMISEYFTMSNPTSVRVSEGEVMFDSLESGKRYFVRVREIRLDSKGNEVLGAWSSLKSIKTE